MPDAHITFYRRGPHKPAKIVDIRKRIHQNLQQEAVGNALSEKVAYDQH